MDANTSIYLSFLSINFRDLIFPLPQNSGYRNLWIHGVQAMHLIPAPYLVDPTLFLIPLNLRDWNNPRLSWNRLSACADEQICINFSWSSKSYKNASVSGTMFLTFVSLMSFAWRSILVSASSWLRYRFSSWILSPLIISDMQDWSKATFTLRLPITEQLVCHRFSKNRINSVLLFSFERTAPHCLISWLPIILLNCNCPTARWTLSAFLLEFSR